MGFWSKKTVSFSVGEVLNMGNSQIEKLIKQGKIEGKTPEEVRQTAKQIRQRTEGERGLGAVFAAAKGGGTKNRNYQSIPLKDRVHPAEYRRILEREAKRRGKL